MARAPRSNVGRVVFSDFSVRNIFYVFYIAGFMNPLIPPVSVSFSSLSLSGFLFFGGPLQMADYM